MAVPSKKSILEIGWIDKLSDPDYSAKITHQAMKWAETGKSTKALNEFYDEHVYSEMFAAPASLSRVKGYGDRVRTAMAIMDKALDTFGVEGLAEYEIEYLNTGETYAETIVYDWDEGKFMLTSWGDVVEQKDMNRESGEWYNNPSYKKRKGCKNPRSFNGKMQYHRNKLRKG